MQTTDDDTPPGGGLQVHPDPDSGGDAARPGFSSVPAPDGAGADDAEIDGDSSPISAYEVSDPTSEHYNPSHPLYDAEVEGQVLSAADEAAEEYEDDEPQDFAAAAAANQIPGPPPPPVTPDAGEQEELFPMGKLDGDAKVTAGNFLPKGVDKTIQVKMSAAQVPSENLFPSGKLSKLVVTVRAGNVNSQALYDGATEKVESGKYIQGLTVRHVQSAAAAFAEERAAGFQEGAAAARAAVLEVISLSEHEYAQLEAKYAAGQLADAA